MKSEAASASQTVEPIDWAYWEKEIQAPGLVAEMKAEYEALTFPTVDPNSPENLAKYAELEAMVAEAEKQKALGASELTEVDRVIATVNKVKAEGLNWSMDQWHAFVPGLEAQHKAEYENEDY